MGGFVSPREVFDCVRLGTTSSVVFSSDMEDDSVWPFIRLQKGHCPQWVLLTPQREDNLLLLSYCLQRAMKLRFGVGG